MSAATFLGYWVYPPYRQEVKRDLYIHDERFGSLFESKEHIAFFAFALVLAGAFVMWRAARSANPELNRLCRILYGLAAVMALAVGVMGIMVASANGFADAAN